jgi:cell division septation protein DedD
VYNLMEKKTTRRIIGVLVVIALVIILLPLMFNGPENQSPIQTSEAKAPAFPGMEVEASAATDNPSMIPPSQSGALINRIVAPSAAQQQGSAPTPAAAAAAAEVVASNSSQTLSQSTDIANYPAANGPENVNMISPEGNAALSSVSNAPMLKPINDLTSANAGENIIVIDSDGDGSTTTLSKALAQADLSKSQMEAPMQSELAPTEVRSAVMQAQAAQPAPAPTAPVDAVQAAAPMVAAITKTETTIAKGVVTTTTTTAKAATKKHVAKIKKATPATETAKTVARNDSSTPATAADLKKSAWIVQLGSFKNKLNAERLTNSLRAKGYKAFTLETKSNGQTRVCVGPEFKQMAAATLASKIQSDINMHGIIMTYQPLAL